MHAPEHRGRLRTHRPGQALVEFAILAPILLLIILGMVEFARAWSAHHVLADAAREGARLSAIADQSIGPAEVRTAVQQAMANGGLNAGSATTACPSGTGAPCIEVLDNAGERGLPSTVYIEYPLRLGWLAPFMSWASGEETITLKSRIIMRNE